MEQTTETKDTPTASVTPEVEPKEDKGFPALGVEHEITSFASSAPTRYVLNAIYLDSERKVAVATDGSMLIRVPYEITEEFPPLGEHLKPETNSVILPAKQFKDAMKDAGKGRGTLPILEKVAVAKNCEPNKVVLVSTDLDTQLDRKIKVVEGTFPNYTQFLPTEDPPHKISLSPYRLKVICDYALKHGRDQACVTIGMSDELSPITFSITLKDGKKATGVLMPMRMS